MAQQTAMQEAIEYLKSFNLEASAIILEDKFLEKEKEQIIDSYIMGSYDMAAKEFRPEQYYNETYKTSNNDNS